MAKKSTKASGNARQAKIQAAQKAQRGGVNKIVVATVVVIVAIVGTVGGVIWSQQSQEKAITGGGNALPQGVSELGVGFPAFADVTAADGAPTVDVFEDFQCPACAQFETAMGETITGLAEQGKVKLVYHVKNFLDDTLRNDSSTRSGNAAFCAADAGSFQQFHNLIFANQPTEGAGYDDATLRSLAEQSGITGGALTTWQSCFEAGKYVDYINSVEQRSYEDGVRGTPTVRINGKDTDLRLIGTPEAFTKAVEDATK